MNNSEFYKTDILLRYLGKETTAAENKAVEDWYGESSENMDYFIAIKGLWDDTVDHHALYEKYEGKKVFDQLFLKADTVTGIRIVPFKWLAAAASIILLLGLGLVGYNFWKSTEIQFKAEKQVSEITLKDSSHIWLNKNTTITYAKNNRKERLIMLSGEAYFDVSPDPERPFVILTSNSRITVLGTKFNVRSYPDDAETEVNVTSGNVKMHHISALPARMKDLTLSAGEKGIINNTDSIPVKETIHDLNYNSWKSREFVFHNTNLMEIVALANAVYGVQIDIQSDHIDQCNLTGQYSCKSIDEMLDMLKVVLDVTVEYKGDKKYTIKSTSCLVNE
jgi:ferric-dicitrate binding protein FerR (iron transport regulator)